MPQSENMEICMKKLTMLSGWEGWHTVSHQLIVGICVVMYAVAGRQSFPACDACMHVKRSYRVNWGGKGEQST